MFELRQAHRERIAIDRIQFYPGGDRPVVCGLELLPCTGSRTLAVVTELSENFGPSITNVAEQLASAVCTRFDVHPDLLVWVEHYGQTARGGLRPFERVTFARRFPHKVEWMKLANSSATDGWPVYFADPEWRIIGPADWTALGHPSRAAVPSG